MNTKTFAQQARNILMDGVATKLMYWGFNPKGEVLDEPVKISGGYSFRGEVFDDANVPHLWKSLKNAIAQKGIEVIVEEAAYTWFNRIMALKIMSKNQYEDPTVDYADGLSNTPQILQQARQGNYDYLNTAEKARLQRIIGDYNKDQEAFALLLIGYCHSNTMMQNVFGHINDYTELLLPDNMLQTSGFLHLLNTTDAISDDEYKEVELIGWLYQFYISERKDEVFASFKKNKKAEAKDIPAATQIFTPNWIVKYMVQNTAGKIWLDKHPNSPLKTSMKYLVENENVIASDSAAISSDENNRHPELVSGSHPTENQSVIASETKQPLISEVKDLTLIDPACGSGHILVEGFDLLYQMYLEEYYEPEEAVESILKNNLFGLDIDDRAAQLATFAILLKAAQKYRDVFSKGWLPNVYAMPDDTLANWFTEKKYRKESNWLQLQGMQLAQPVTIEWKENKKNKLVKRIATFDTGNILNEKVVDLLRDYCEQEITVDYSRELDLFWGEYPKPYNYNEFYYAVKLLRQGKNLGSLIKLNISTEVLTHIKTTYQNWLERETNLELDIEEIAILSQLKAYIPVLLILTKKYTAVVANPPYMGQKSMNAALKNYVNSNYPITKSDLMTVFMEVIPNLTQNDSRFALINLPSWLFLSSFEKIRKEYINNFYFDSLLHMGRGIFGIDFGSVAFAIKKTKNENAMGSYFRLHERNFQHILYKDIEKLFLYSNGNVNYKYDFGQYRGEEGITEIPEQGTAKGLKLFYPNIPQTNFIKIPGSPIAYWVSDNAIKIFDKECKIKDITNPRKGMVTGDNLRFTKFWFEISTENFGLNFSNRLEAKESCYRWFPYKKGGDYRKWYGNNEYVVNWENDGDLIRKTLHPNGLRPISSNYNLDFIFKSNISWSAVAAGGFGARYSEEGFLCDAGGSACYPKQEDTTYLLSYFNSKVSQYFLSIYNPTINYQAGNIANLPFIILDNKKLTIFSNNSVQLSKKDWDSRETSWDFKESPLLNNSTSIEKAFKIWQENVTKDFFQLHNNEEELNRIFIDIYGLQEELTPEVALKDITILQEELNKKELEELEENFRANGAAAIELPINKAEVISQFISYAIGIYMGRYRLDKPGLNIAHPNPTAEELASYNVIASGSEAISPSETENTVSSSAQRIENTRHPELDSGSHHSENQTVIANDSEAISTIQIDEDAIIPLMGNNCNFPDDAVHLVNELLDAIWGAETRIENSNFIQECLNKDLDKFLVKDFNKYHCGMYKKKPIYWLFSSKKGAFQALVYMHRMNAFTVEKLRANYLLEHLKDLRNAKDDLEANASSLSTQEAKRLDQIRKDIAECEDYDMDLKTIADAQITIDLDDGVTANYKLFETVVAKIK